MKSEARHERHAFPPRAKLLPGVSNAVGEQPVAEAQLFFRVQHVAPEFGDDLDLLDERVVDAHDVGRMELRPLLLDRLRQLQRAIDVLVGEGRRNRADATLKEDGHRHRGQEGTKAPHGTEV